MRVAVKIELSDAGRQRLERLSRSRSAAVRLRERSRLVLMAAPRARGTQCRAAERGAGDAPIRTRPCPSRPDVTPVRIPTMPIKTQASPSKSDTLHRHPTPHILIPVTSPSSRRVSRCGMTHPLQDPPERARLPDPG